MTMTNLLNQTLATLIPDEWSAGHEHVAYRLYDLSKPHCGDAVAYFDVAGKRRHRCRHEDDKR